MVNGQWLMVNFFVPLTLGQVRLHLGNENKS